MRSWEIRFSSKIKRQHGWNQRRGEWRKISFWCFGIFSFVKKKIWILYDNATSSICQNVQETKEILNREIFHLQICFPYFLSCISIFVFSCLLFGCYNGKIVCHLASNLLWHANCTIVFSINNVLHNSEIVNKKMRFQRSALIIRLRSHFRFFCWSFKDNSYFSTLVIVLSNQS